MITFLIICLKKLEVTGHLDVSTLPNIAELNLNTFVNKSKWLSATVQDNNLYKQRVNIYLSELELPENIAEILVAKYLNT